MDTVQESLEQSQVFARRRIEGAAAARFQDVWLSQLPQFVTGGSRIVYHCQGAQVAAVARQCLLLKVDHWSHASSRDHNGWVSHDWSLLNREKKAIIDYLDQNPLEG
jgi:hypothetical protein